MQRGGRRVKISGVIFFFFCDATDAEVVPDALETGQNCACQQKNKPFLQAAPLDLPS